MTRQRLDGKVTLITGGTGGLGTAIVELFAREGARLVITDVAEGPQRDLSHRIEARGAEVVAARLDVSSARE
ncbi:SDR family NAD(P)-dependent oxidoreductase [Streptomyces endocoffeicus]|uniref:SDR family NAD(P)-dependent oxidoreductase n=1 Tax=Streptomyces endocoffeicus TaxID=2898945 RepID=UPI0022AA186C